MSNIYAGGCTCGAIRYEIDDKPIFMNHCQCRDCQQMSGTGHASYLTFPSRATVELKGLATHWDRIGESGSVKTNGFCPTCGSPVYLTFAAMPDLFTVHAASLDDPTKFNPQVLTYSAGGYEWDHIDPSLTTFESMPTQNI
ncbi:MAG: aldehyde-activating protein [Moraxellaceae bacterium]|nr:MAG: aldehyde-activating protein [Moraxellaceae bacterium]